MHSLNVAIDLIQTSNPRNLTEFQTLGIKVRHVADGNFRHVFLLGACGEAVIKIPKDYHPDSEDPAWKNPLVHARKEIETIERICSDDRYLHLKRYLPRLLYRSIDTGVVIMPRYRPMRRVKFNREEKAVARMFRETLKLFTADYDHKNMMRDGKGNIVIADLGY